MKSSTPSPSNILSLQADKRIDMLMKKQKAEHEHLISAYHKEMQSLRDALNFSMDRFSSISERGETAFEEFRDLTQGQIDRLEKQIVEHRATIAHQKNMIEDLSKQLASFQESYCTNAAAEKGKREIEDKVNKMTLSHIVAFQDAQREFKILFNSLEEEFSNFKKELEKRFNALIDTIEKNFNVTKIDREGVLHEIRKYEYGAFVTEKKIENIYTLIDRINKRGQLCHKPE